MPQQAGDHRTSLPLPSLPPSPLSRVPIPVPTPCCWAPVSLAWVTLPPCPAAPAAPSCGQGLSGGTQHRLALGPLGQAGVLRQQFSGHAEAQGTPSG